MTTVLHPSNCTCGACIGYRGGAPGQKRGYDTVGETPPAKPALTSKDEGLPPARRIGRLIGDLDFALSSLNPQHNTYRVVLGVQDALKAIKVSLAVETGALLSLPTWKECEDAVTGGYANPLQAFIYENEPADTGVGGFQTEDDFRRMLAEAVAFARRSLPAASMPMACENCGSMSVSIHRGCCPERKMILAQELILKLWRLCYPMDGFPVESGSAHETEGKRELSATEAASFDKAFSRSPRRVDETKGKLPPLDDTMRKILGRPNFTCIQFAQWLREKGHDIARKAEDEQAAVLHWMLGLYFEHGEKWIQAADAYLKPVKATCSGDQS